MIVRETNSDFFLITQPDHAQLAEEIVKAVKSETALKGEAREAILLATREHDNGWTEVDAFPTIEPDSGRPCDFMHGPAAVKHELWLRGVTRTAMKDPHAGALIAEHAITVYGYRQHDADWDRFFEALRAIRDDLLQRIGRHVGTRLADFAHEYRCVRLGDSLSLHFCHAWTTPQTTLGYTATIDGPDLVISPDPFDGATIPLRVIGRRIAARSYASDADLRAALAIATPEVLAGQARGIR
jgi:hypothetical protein